MGDGLEIKREVHGDILWVRLAGNITEDSQIEELAKDLKPFVVLDLLDVKRINSYGIRQWVNVMKKIHGEVKQLVFHRCPPAFVEQFNMISNFGGGGLVYSFFLPFYCEACDCEELELYSLPGGKTPDDTPELPAPACEKCAKPLQFNDIEDEYFYFLQHQKGLGVSSDLAALAAKNS